MQHLSGTLPTASVALSLLSVTLVSINRCFQLRLCEFIGTDYESLSKAFQAVPAIIFAFELFNLS